MSQGSPASTATNVLPRLHASPPVAAVDGNAVGIAGGAHR